MWSLLLPNWCTVHYQNHSELTCQPCVDILKHVSQVEETSKCQPLASTNEFSFQAKDTTILTRASLAQRESSSQLEQTQVLCSKLQLETEESQSLPITPTPEMLPMPRALVKKVLNHDLTQNEVQESLPKQILNSGESSSELCTHLPSNIDDQHQSEPPYTSAKQRTVGPEKKEIPTPDQLWSLKFDSSKSKSGSGAGVELTNPKGNTYFASYRLQFCCTNNVVDYGALARGLMFSHKKKVTYLMLMGDSKVIIKQVHNQYTCHNKRLDSYKNRVWNLIEDFDAFRITLIPRKQNQIVHDLAVTTSTLEPMQDSKLKIFSVELVSILAVLDNVQNFQVFDDDQHMLTFLASSNFFKGKIIDESDRDQGEWNPEGCDMEGVMNLKSKNIPKGMVA